MSEQSTVETVVAHAKEPKFAPITLPNAVKGQTNLPFGIKIGASKITVPKGAQERGFRKHKDEFVYLLDGDVYDQYYPENIGQPGWYTVFSDRHGNRAAFQILGCTVRNAEPDCPPDEVPRMEYKLRVAYFGDQGSHKDGEERELTLIDKQPVRLYTAETVIRQLAEKEDANS